MWPKFVIAVAFLVSSGAFAQKTCDQEDLLRAQELYDTAKYRVRVGTMGPIDLVEAEYNLFEAQGCNRQVRDQDWCEQKITHLKKVLYFRQKKFDGGMTVIDSVVDAQAKIRFAKSECGMVEE